MKTIKFLFFIILTIGSTNVYAGDIDYIKTANGVILIASESNHGKLKKLTSNYFTGFMSTYSALVNGLGYNLELYSDKVTKQYALKIYLWSPEDKPRILPSKSKALLKLADDSVLELNSVINDIDYEHGFSFTYFPIDEADLKKTFGGVKKIRLETLTINDNNSTIIDYHDIEIKKNKMGKNLNDWYDAINKEYQKNVDKLVIQPKSSTKNKTNDIKEGF